MAEFNATGNEPTRRARPTGWGAGFELLDSPETRRLDKRIKLTGLLVLSLILAYCCQVITVLTLRFGAVGVVLGLAVVALTGFIGPPRWHPGLGLIRVAVAGLLASPLLISIAACLWVAEFVSEFFVRRLHMAGHSGKVMSGRHMRRERAYGIRQIMRWRREKFLRELIPEVPHD